VGGFVEFVKRVAAEYQSDDCASRAASLAYFALASLFPALLLMLTLLGQFVSGSQAQDRVVEIVGYYLPIPTFKSFVRTNLHAAVELRGIMGLLGGLVLLWSSKGMFLAAERGINLAWQLQRPRHTVATYCLAIATTVALGVILVVQFSLIALLRAAVTWKIPVLGYSLDSISLVWNALSLIISPLMLFSIFLLLYSALPRQRMPYRAVWRGAAFAAVAYRVGESLFIYYVASISHVTVLYGAASGLLILMLWLYLVANLYFAGAEIVYVYAADHDLLPKSA
jgi:membrane protein